LNSIRAGWRWGLLLALVLAGGVPAGCYRTLR
jgi:hypothetical protein